MSLYENTYLQDPESLNITECQWNEFNDSHDRIIECVWHARKLTLHEVSGQSVIPPMEAPLGISEESRAAFIAEVENEQPRDTLKRFLAVIREFESSAKTEVSDLVQRLVRHFGELSLRYHALDLVVELAAIYPTFWNSLMVDDTAAQKLIASFDPRPQEFVEWTKLFYKVPNQNLLSFLETAESDQEENKITKLIQFRSLQDPESFVNLLWSSSPKIQRTLLRILSTYWTAPQSDALYARFRDSLADPIMAKAWFVAAMKAGHDKVFLNLETDFLKRKLFRKTENGETALSIVLDAFAENMNRNIFDFLKSHLQQLKSSNKKKAEQLVKTFQRKNSS